MRFFRTWPIAAWIYPAALFRLKTSLKEIVLTFDDGPDPSSTLIILDILREYNARAMFFCSGRKAEKYPGLIDEIRKAGHVLGNHGYDHLDGLRTGLNEYLLNASRADSFTSDVYFRPPRGRMGIRQYRDLSRKYRIVMWDLMPYDFDLDLDDKAILDVLTRKTRPGSVIVLHDSKDSSGPLILRSFLDWAMKEGYSFVLPV
ncbi:MAG: polysaccharide deacetylase family protein [Bacteroidales bacterium]